MIEHVIGKISKTPSYLVVIFSTFLYLAIQRPCNLILTLAIEQHQEYNICISNVKLLKYAQEHFF